MAQCKWCKEKGLFLRVSSLGLCQRCAPEVVLDLSQRARIIEESAELVRKSKNLKTRLSRCDALIDHATALQTYEEHGINIMTPPPSALIKIYAGIKDELRLAEAKDLMTAAKAKTEIGTTVANKVALMTKVLLQIKQLESDSDNQSGFSEVVGEAEEMLRKLRLEDHLEQARKAEFKKQTKKAIDQCYEALFLLRNDTIDDEIQREQISELETKIRELGG